MGFNNISRPTSKKVRARVEEIKSNDKFLRNLKYEHSRLVQRIDEVKSPEYVFQLRQKIKEMSQQISEVQKSKKKLAQKQFRREKVSEMSLFVEN